MKYEIPLSEKENLFIFLMKLDIYQKNQEKTEIETERILKSVIDEFTPLRIKSYLYRDDEQYFLLFFQPKQWSTESVPARTWNRLYTNLKGALGQGGAPHLVDGAVRVNNSRIAARSICTPYFLNKSSRSCVAAWVRQWLSARVAAKPLGLVPGEGARLAAAGHQEQIGKLAN